MSVTKITVETKINAETKKVWDYWTRPEHITKWNFATDDWQCPKAENDLRAGGKYFARMEAKDGSFDFNFEAVYDEVVDGQKIAYTMSDGRQAEEWFLQPSMQDEKVRDCFHERIRSSRTNGAFMNLIDGNTDIIVTHRTISPEEKAHACGLGRTHVN